MKILHAFLVVIACGCAPRSLPGSNMTGRLTAQKPIGEVLTADGAIGANLLIKPSASTNDRYVVAVTTDISAVIVGSATTAAAGAGSMFSAATIYGQERVLLSDGTGTITRGQVLSLSSSQNGYVVQGTSNQYCVATTSAAATLGATVSCR